MLVKRKETKEFEKLEAGIYDAVCVNIIDLGTQNSGINDKGEIIFARKIRITFELVDNLMQDGRPFIASKEFTLSLHEKSKLFSYLTSWRGKAFTKNELENGFDMATLLGVACQIQIIETKNEKTNKSYSVINNILPKNKHFTFDKLHNELFEFNLDNFDPEIYEKVYPFLKEKIENSPEFKKLNSTQGQEETEDISF